MQFKENILDSVAPSIQKLLEPAGLLKKMFVSSVQQGHNFDENPNVSL